MISRYPVFRERLSAEWAEARQAAEKAIQAFAAYAPEHPQASIYLDAVALNLHGFYNGLERIFEWVARQLDGTMPEGRSWHRDLLNQMSLTISGVRPALIQPTTQNQLEAYLGFRHLVRNLYTWQFDPEKIGQLIHSLPDTVARLDSDFQTFQQFLDAASRADTLTE